ncbi:hypothetical protein PQE66_gp054 [Bacillus phage PBC2]|uniref:Uncharacterized protein n=1 Tax=Bacillus phage PBC2 TaxID=1675029 RepID=A0A218KBV0_9CAUD|nr:hypothetical protein PQE66_gp054 [Bacillus phage PBC2]AKQ08369.1 hypothetical protein PBC2_054 [Bacillus phage PBC2]
MRKEEVIKAKINHLTKVRERINKRIIEVKDGRDYPNMSMDNKKIYSVLMSWWDRVGIQINALQYTLSNTVELGRIDRKVYNIEHHEIMGEEDLFREEPDSFLIRTRDGNYLKGWSIEYRNGQDFNKYETTIYRHEAVKFKGGKEDKIKYITDGLLAGWRFEYIYE